VDSIHDGLIVFSEVRMDFRVAGYQVVIADDLIVELRLE
jgi:hypothetical protein